MIDPKLVLNDSRPMLKVFFETIGFEERGQDFLVSPYLEDLSNWLSDQIIENDDIPFLGVRLACFIGEFFIENYEASWLIDGRRIFISLPFTQGIHRQFDTFDIAKNIIQNDQSLKNTIFSIVN